MWVSSFKPTQKDTVKKHILLNTQPKFSLTSLTDRSDSSAELVTAISLRETLWFSKLKRQAFWVGNVLYLIL